MRLSKAAGSLAAGTLTVLIILSFSTGYVNEDPVYASAPAGCDTAAVMSDHGAVLPPGATEVSAPFDTVIYNGALSDLYPNSETGDFYANLPCPPSIGGTLPPGALSDTSENQTAAERFLNPVEQAVPSLPTPPPTLPDLPAFTVNCYIRLIARVEAEGGTGNPANPANVDPEVRRTQPESRPTTPATGTGRTTPPAAGTPTSRAGGLRPVPDGPVAAAGSLDRPVKCDEASFLRAGQPFEGRDIIYVHGLATDHFKKGLVGPAAPARRTWPDHAADFLNPGQYFRTYAEEYWRRHIRENLFDPMAPSNGVAGWEFYGSGPPRYVPKSNRYLIVAWSSNQRLVVAQHALLEQIRLAMTTHKNVVTPPGYPAEHRRPFCANGCIVISHSTGGLLTSTAMAQAAAGEFGPGGAQIPAYMRAHVAFEDALSGSRLATAGWLLSQVQAPASPPSMLCRMQDYLLEQPADGVCSFNTGFLTNSILYDLMPIVTQTLWGDVLNATPVPTLTVAGGHPSGDYGDTSWLLPGLDDGVVSMNSACANPNPVFPFVRAPSGLSVSSFVQAFDMGIPVHRALKYFIAQRNHKHSVLPGPQYLAGACQPALSPTGMVMPATAFYSGTPHDARARYTNHFSFLQGAIDHSYDGGGKSGNYWPSSIQTQQQNGQPASVTRRYFDGSPISFGPNAEEMSAITDAAVYAQAPDGTYLVHPRFADQMGEEVRGRAIRFKLFGKKRTIWIWKRTYHLLNNWQTKQSSHFAYEYVGRR